jgi:hypothetical protein
VATGHGCAVAVGADLCGNRFDDEGRVCAEPYGRWIGRSQPSLVMCRLVAAEEMKMVGTTILGLGPFKAQ